jgi:diaminopimelate epimerase
MTKHMEFTKMVAAGNDFVVIDNRAVRLSRRDLASLSRRICDRKFGAGADGLLVVDSSRSADFAMRTMNPDGSEAEMCGNGARCFALYCARLMRRSVVDLKIRARAGLIRAHVDSDQVRVRLTAPRDVELDVPVRIGNRTLRMSYIDTGVPHAIMFVAGLSSLEIVELGRRIRYHRAFAPRGVNVNFVEVTGDHTASIRTYERGVEDETLACGTGSTAGALITGLKLERGSAAEGSRAVRRSFDILTRSGEVLKISYALKGTVFSDVWLEGKAAIVYKGVWMI